MKSEYQDLQCKYITNILFLNILSTCLGLNENEQMDRQAVLNLHCYVMLTYTCPHALARYVIELTWFKLHW